MAKEKAISLRVPGELFEQIEALVRTMAADSAQVGRVTKSSVAVHAIQLGVRQLQERYPPAEKSGSVPAERRKRPPRRPVLASDIDRGRS